MRISTFVFSTHKLPPFYNIALILWIPLLKLIEYCGRLDFYYVMYPSPLARIVHYVFEQLTLINV